jgi:hypothetical protein
VRTVTGRRTFWIMTTWYDRLGVSPAASQAELDTAYEAKTAAAERDGDTAGLREIRHAYDLLSDGRLRERYDTWLEAPSETAEPQPGEATAAAAAVEPAQAGAGLPPVDAAATLPLDLPAAPHPVFTPDGQVLDSHFVAGPAPGQTSSSPLASLAGPARAGRSRTVQLVVVVVLLAVLAAIVATKMFAPQVWRPVDELVTGSPVEAARAAVTDVPLCTDLADVTRRGPAADTPVAVPAGVRLQPIAFGDLAGYGWAGDAHAQLTQAGWQASQGASGTVPGSTAKVTVYVHSFTDHAGAQDAALLYLGLSCPDLRVRIPADRAGAAAAIGAHGDTRMTYTQWVDGRNLYTVVADDDSAQTRTALKTFLAEF